MTDVSAIVLAAGMSTRMDAGNKLLLDFRDRPLVRHVVETVVEAGLLEVIVVVGYDGDRIAGSLTGLPVKIVRNDRFEEGMTTSIHAGVNLASQTASGYMICLSDLPLLDAGEITALALAFAASVERDPQAIVVPFHKGERGNPVVFAASYRGDILAERGLMGCRGLVKQNREHVVEVEMETDHVLVDVDTLEDYEASLSSR